MLQDEPTSRASTPVTGRSRSLLTLVLPLGEYHRTYRLSCSGLSRFLRLLPCVRRSRVQTWMHKVTKYPATRTRHAFEHQNSRTHTSSWAVDLVSASKHSRLLSARRFCFLVMRLGSSTVLLEEGMQPSLRNFHPCRSLGFLPDNYSLSTLTCICAA